MSAAADRGLRTIRTQVPARLDRLPWSRFHWMAVGGIVEVLFGVRAERQPLENVASPLTATGRGTFGTPRDRVA